VIRPNAPVADTFDEVKSLVHYFVEEYYRAHKVDKAELVSAAYYGFMQAYDTYDPKYGEFSTWVGVKVKKRLSDTLRGKIKHDEKKHLTNVDQNYMESVKDREEPVCDFDPKNWMKKLSPDAKFVAELVVNTPVDIKFLIAQLGSESPGNWRQAIREFLSELSWTPGRM
jgi:hypothetical protein